MGAAPTALVVGVAAPAGLDASWLDSLADGLGAECDPLGVSVVGGDLVAADELTISVTALGDLAGRDPVTRSGAQPGDVVVVAGRLGFAAAGLALLHDGRGDDPLADAHRCPDIAYAAALRLAAAGATAMVDVSDGLVADVGHIARMSGVRIELASDDLPLAPELVDAGLSLGADPLAWVAAGGDDHAVGLEAMAGHANQVTIPLNHDGSVSVEDNGRGIPVGIRRRRLRRPRATGSAWARPLRDVTSLA